MCEALPGYDISLDIERSVLASRSLLSACSNALCKRAGADRPIQGCARALGKQ